MTIAHALHDMLKPALGQSGGGKQNGGLLLFVIILTLFLIRAFIVQYSFSMIVPNLIARFSAEPEKTLANYRPLTYVEAIFLTLLTSSLFN